MDDDERYALCEELNEYLNEECVIIPLWQPIAVRAYQKDLQGVEINAGGTLYFKDCYWGE